MNGVVSMAFGPNESYQPNEWYEHVCGVPGAACARFKRALKKDEDMADLYKKCINNSAKAKFRLDWATSVLDAGTKSAVKTKSHIQEES